MKRSQHCLPMTLNRNAYPSDLTDEQWELVEPVVPAISSQAAYHVHSRRSGKRNDVAIIPSPKNRTSEFLHIRLKPFVPPV